MRKHHTRWVALCSAVAISTSGLVGLAGPAVAEDENTRAFAWPVVSQGVSSYSLDGYELTYLPPGLDRYGINATSTTDRQGNSRSQLSWVQGPEQLYGRVTVLRAESLQEIDDLRSSRYGHLSEDSLEQLPESEAFQHGAYLAEESGDLFWIDRPGIAVATHLQPDRWESAELVRMAEAVAEVTGVEAAPVEDAGEAAPEEAGPEKETEPEESPDEEVTEDEATDEAPVEETPAEETPAEEVPVEEVPVEEVPVEDEGTDEAPVGQVPVDEVPEDEAPAEETPVEEGPATEAPVEESPDEAAEPTEEQAPEGEEPVEETPAEETPDEETAQEDPAQEVTDQAPVEEVGDGDGAEEESSDPVEADLPDQTPSREVKTCVTEHFVDFDSASSSLDHELMTPTSQKFIEKALNKNDLSDDERDRLLATVWYYGHEGDKVTAIDDCAEHFDLRRGQVEDVVNEVSDIIAELAEEAQAEADGSQAQVSEEDVSVDITDPIGADEWEELWDSLPWSIPTEQR